VSAASRRGATASCSEHTSQGRKCLLLDEGAAVLKDYVLQDGTLDIDVTTSASRGFFGLQFRIADDGVTAEEVYLRQHKSGLPDAMQYTPILGAGRNWQIYNGQGFTGAVDVPKDTWFRLRLEVAGAQGRLYVGDTTSPALVMTDLKSGVRKCQVALFTLTGETCFSQFRVRTTPAAAWQRRLPPMPAGTLTRWSLSPAYDALARNLEQPMSPVERDSVPWQEVERKLPVRDDQPLPAESAGESLVPARLLQAPRAAAGDEGGLRPDDHRGGPAADAQAPHRLQ
jgi:hypothetical protein